MSARAILAGALALACAAGASAQDAAAGKAKAAACTVCHGPIGVAVAPDTPNLAGQPASYIEEQLKAYRGGTRKHEIMTLMAKPLSDADVANLAAWFSSIKIEAAAPK